MGVRYGRRTSDGTFEYHDSRESLVASANRESRSARTSFFGLIGLLIGAFLAYFALTRYGLKDWPKWVRFTGVIAGAGLGCYVLARLADLIVMVFGALVLIGIVSGIASLIWKAV